MPRLSHAAESSTTQTITLAPGWNLISIQVGSAPMPVTTFKDSLSNRDRLVEIWGYAPSGNPSVPGQWRSYQPLEPTFPSDLAALELGKGYWVKVGQTTTATLTGLAWNGITSLVKGWNLVGFPGVALTADEVQEITSVFGASMTQIQQVWSFDTSTQLFKGFDLTAIPALKDLNAIQPGRGYWVYSLSDAMLSLAPVPSVALPADSDASPPQPAETFFANDPRFLGTNDAKYVGRVVHFRDTKGLDTAFDLNGNGILDEPTTQDTVLFETASEAVSLTIANGGTGSFTWQLENNVSWIFTVPADPQKYPGNKGRPRSAAGTVSSEKDTLILYADRAGMSPGRKSGESLTLWAGGIAFPVKLLIDVPEIDGDWAGYATTTRVSGKNISLGEVRLALNAFRPADAVTGGFRAVLNKDQSILFPRDLYLEGSFYSGDAFKLTTNFSMPAGDRNAPPYASFSNQTDSDPKKNARLDKDFNGDGKVDLMNPFPFGLRREVTLIGRRVTPSRLEGDYIESIRGMLPPTSGNTLPADAGGGSFFASASDQILTQSQPVIIEGTFVLDRKSYEPTLRSAVNVSDKPGTSIGGSQSTIVSQVLQVSSTAQIQSVTVSVSLTFPDPSLVRLVLRGPADQVIVLREFGLSTPLPDSFTIGNDQISGLAGGPWTLEVEWDPSTGERGTLNSWGLKIEGLSTRSVRGKIVANGTGAAIAGAAVRLDGALLPATDVTDEAGAGLIKGSFAFTGLTENDYTLFISKPGYASKSYTFFVGESDVIIPDISLVPLDITSPQIEGPIIGMQPFTGSYSVLTPLNPAWEAVNQVAWSFGDGSSPLTGPLTDYSTVTHEFGKPGEFTITATLANNAIPQPPAATSKVLVQRRVPDASAATQVIALGFVGAFAARTDSGANVASATIVPAALPDLATTFTPNGGGTPVAMKSVVDYTSGKPMVSYAVSATGPGAISATVYQESQSDSGSVDLDRTPLLASGASSMGPEDTDFTGQTYIRYNATTARYDAISSTAAGSGAVLANHDNAPAGSYTKYSLPDGQARPTRMRLFASLGGHFLGLYGADSTVGSLRLRPGAHLATYHAQGLSTARLLVEKAGTMLIDGAFDPVDFGAVAATGSATLTLRNTGSVSLTGLNAAFTGDEATRYSLGALPATLAPGASATVTLTFTPAATVPAGQVQAAHLHLGASGLIGTYDVPLTGTRSAP
jgi:subtilisin-like proprotein convertase family protein